MAMKKNLNGKQDVMILQTLNELVPKDHIVRKMERHLDLTFIYDEVAHLCSDTGRKSIDPVVIFKILLIRYMFGLKSIRETMRQIEVNVAYRWYLGITFDQKVPDHSSLSQLYRRKFADSDIFEKIFYKILDLAEAGGYIDYTDIYADATHTKASANKRKYSEEVVETVTSIKVELLEDINELRDELGKKEIDLEDVDEDEDNQSGISNQGKRKKLKSEKKKIKVSQVDPDSGYYYRDEKEKGFVYQDHRIVEGKNNFIISTQIEPGNIHDSKVLVQMLEKLKERGIDYKNIALDSGYNSLDIMHYFQVEEKNSIIAHRRFGRKKKKDGSYYDRDLDVFVCGQGLIFELRNVDKRGYKIYHQKTQCIGCPTPCYSQSENKKTFMRHIWQDLRDVENRERRLSKEGKEIYARRKETIERSFADAKQNHGMRWTQYRGKKKNQNFNWLLCAAQNLKKLCKLKSTDYARAINEGKSSIFNHIFAIFSKNFIEMRKILA